MKRSKKVALMLMVPATTLIMAGCGEEREQAMVFNSPDECVQSGLSTQDQCRADYVAAQSAHPQVAPKYQDKTECEADFGAGHCETAPQKSEHGSSMFMPMMMGFLAGQMMNRPSVNQNMAPSAMQQPAQGQKPGSATATGGGGFASRFQPQPLYKARNDDTFRTANSNAVSTRTGLTKVKPSDVQAGPGKVVNRGGFGSQAATRGSLGG